ncbi:hypothetical protein [Arthrobacter oryzae]|uniref:hypothetical protein n=1 Tax=Arthrobacter oryzae TaxID=409290 RepID=UPI00273C4D17|nr:hypothetical protein [Arthrobacter oryzae]WLQ08267.1 hypothetical protein Q8Z05_09020 [Arthrobacter oryzae]
MSTTPRYGKASRMCSQWFEIKYTEAAAMKTVSKACVQDRDGRRGGNCCGPDRLLIP